MPTLLPMTLAISVHMVAPALPGSMSAELADPSPLRVTDVPSPPAPPRLALRSALRLADGLEPVRDAETRRQTGSQPSKRGRMIAGALIGFVMGSVIGATVGQNADVCGGKPKSVCVALGGGLGARWGALIARGT